jgi:predicted DNA-binding protein
MSRPVSSRGPRLKTRSQVFYLPDEQIDSLGRLSRQTERSKSDLVREALADYLQQH